MRKIFSALLVCYNLSVSAQSDVIINKTTLYIAEGKYKDAEKYLDSLIAIDARNIDALMMKGNVLLNYELMTNPAINYISPEDESIYGRELVALKDPTVKVTREKAIKIQELWNRCLDIDSGRLDIRKGLCSLYGYADMKQELLAYLPVMAAHAKGRKEDIAYSLMDYTRLIYERGDRAGAYELGKKVAELYPTIAGVWCYMSTLYHRDGDLTNAKLYADKGISVSKPDMAICGDALDIYTAISEPEKVLSTLKAAAADSVFKDFLFYDAIHKYARHDKAWKAEMLSYMKQFTTPQDSNPVYKAASYITSSAFKEDYNGFVSLMQYNLNDFYIMDLAERAVIDYKDSLRPFLVQAQVYIHARNYAKANKIFASLTTRKMDGDIKIDFDLQYAYSLYCAGEYNQAISKWTFLSKFANSFLANTSSYFLGCCYLHTGDKVKAGEHFKKLLDANDESKYGFLAKLRLDKL
jgi:tetratricopeptide (TPR) repeat protein